jgi:hypothetical protein
MKPKSTSKSDTGKAAGAALRVLPPLEPHRRYTIPDASALLSQSRAKTFADLRDGKLASIRDGRRRYIPGTEIIRRSTLAA